MAEDKEKADLKMSNAVADAQAAQKAATSQPSNTVSEETGQFDTRFMLWRAFCARYGVSVDALPSELTGEAKEEWDKMKDSALHKPVEKK